jgi:hypothetical protein
MERSVVEGEKSELDDEDNAELKIQAVNKTQEEFQEEKVLDEPKTTKAYRNLHQLDISFNPEADRIVERIEKGREVLLNHSKFALFGIGAVERNLQPLMKPGIIMIQGLERNGAKPSIKSFKRWRRRKCGKSCRK